METIAHSPLYTHLSETMTGVESIRAYGDEERFVKINALYLDKSTNAWFILQLCNEVRRAPRTVYLPMP